MNKKFYIFILIVIVMIAILSIKMHSIYNSNTTYLFSSHNGFEIDGDTIVKYKKNGGNVVIPKMINGVVITKIGNNAFRDANIESVVFPNTIKEIGASAFANNKLSVLQLPNSVEKIGEEAFMHNNISSLTIGSKVMLGNACFNDNQLDDDNAFFYRFDNGKIDYSELISYGGKIRSTVIIPKNREGIDLLKLGDKCLYGNNIVSINIPESVQKIGVQAFKDNYLVELYLPSSVNEIAIDAFSDNDYLSDLVINNYEQNLTDYPWGASTSNIHWLKK